MRRVMTVVVGLGLVWASAEICFARGPQRGGQGGTMQARHRYGGQFQGMGQGVMQSQGPMWQNQGMGYGMGNSGGQQGNGVQQRNQNGDCPWGNAPAGPQNAGQQKKKQQRGGQRNGAGAS